MSEKEIDEEQSEKPEPLTSQKDTTNSYTQPDFKTLGSVAAIGELMRQMQQDDGNGGRGGNGRGSGNGGRGGNGRGGGNGPSQGMI